MSQIDIFKYIKAIPDIPKEEYGKVIEVPCPCGGTLQCMRAPQSGHLRAKCDKCGFRMME